MPLPDPTQSRAHPPEAFHALAQNLAQILTALTRLIFAHPHGFGPLAGPLHNRIASAARRFAALLAHFAAGRLPRPRATTTTKRPGGPPAIYLPRRRGWIIATIGHHAAAYASQLNHLLTTPETAALLAAAPPEFRAAAARILRPLCHRLGVTLPPTLQLPLALPRPTPPRAPARTPRHPSARSAPEPATPALQRLLPAGFKITLFKPA